MDSKNTGCCSGACDCDCSSGQKILTKPLIIDFLYLDLIVCSRCQGTDKVLEEAIADVEHVLKAAGMDITVNKVNITTRELAIKHRFVSSPTIRINGHDIDADIKETECESCGDLCGDSVDCRVWTYQGVEYNVPPKVLIINALLQSVYGAPKQQDQAEYTLPENLDKFFDAMEHKADK